VEDARILAIGTLRENEAETVIQAKGLAVAPGFIDSHAHSDFTLIADNRAEGKIYQGVTTEINGNCGMSAAPLYGKAVERREEDLKELGIRERWNSVREYREILEKRGMAMNTAMLIGHGNIRGSVIGYENREPSATELSNMKIVFETALQEGGMGLSTGLIYPPGIYSRTDELAELATALKPCGLIYTSHMRSEGAALLESVQEVITIGRAAGVRAHISHIKTAGAQNWHKADAAIGLIKIRLELLDQATDRAYWERVIVSSVISPANVWMEGRTIGEISRLLGCDEIEAVFKVLIEEKLRVGAIFLSMSDENLRKFLSLPFCAIGSDSSARCFDGPTRLGKPHPRTFGAFPRFFGKYVRDDQLMSLTKAVQRVTMLPAAIFGLKGRGQIKEGFSADLAIFDPDTISDRATFEDPFLKPAGIPYVLVNGLPAVWEGEVTQNLSGRMLTG